MGQWHREGFVLQKKIKGGGDSFGHLEETGGKREDGRAKFRLLGSSLLITKATTLLRQRLRQHRLFHLPRGLPSPPNHPDTSARGEVRASGNGLEGGNYCHSSQSNGACDEGRKGGVRTSLELAKGCREGRAPVPSAPVRGRVRKGAGSG